MNSKLITGSACSSGAEESMKETREEVLVRSLVVFLLSLSCFAATTACGAGPLTREQALRILRQHEAELLVNRYENLEFLREPWVLPVVQASADEVAGRVPLALPPIAAHMRGMNQTPELNAYQEDLSHQYASGVFFQALVEEHVVTLAGVKNISVNLGPGMTPPTVGATQVAYTSSSSAPIRFSWEQHDPYHRSAVVNPIEAHFTAITGIAGQGDTREVDASIESVISPELRRLQQIARRVLQQQHRDEQPYVYTCHGRTDDYLCVVLGFKAPQTRVRSYRFQLYDDGWRLAN
jgi:hypothetical protein